MEEKMTTFEEKLAQLLELAKSKKNVLDNKEIEFFSWRASESGPAGSD